MRPPPAKCHQCGAKVPVRVGQCFALCPSPSCVGFGQPLFPSRPKGVKYVAIRCQGRLHYQIKDQMNNVVQCPCCSVNHAIDIFSIQKISEQKVYHTVPVQELLNRRHADFQSSRYSANNKNMETAVKKLEAELESLKVAHQLVVMERDALRDVQGKVKVEPGEETATPDSVNRILVEAQLKLLSQRNATLEQQVKEKNLEIAKSNVTRTAGIKPLMQVVLDKRPAEADRLSSELRLAHAENRRLLQEQVQAHIRSKELERELAVANEDKKNAEEQLGQIKKDHDFCLWTKGKEHKAHFKEMAEAMKVASHFGVMAMMHMDKMNNLYAAENHDSSITSSPSPANKATSAIVEAPDQQQHGISRKRKPSSSPSKEHVSSVPTKIPRDPKSFPSASTATATKASDDGKTSKRSSEEQKIAKIEPPDEVKGGQDVANIHLPNSAGFFENDAEATQKVAIEDHGVLETEAPEEDEEEEIDEWPEEMKVEINESAVSDSCDDIYLVDEELPVRSDSADAPTLHQPPAVFLPRDPRDLIGYAEAASRIGCEKTSTVPNINKGRFFEKMMEKGQSMEMKKAVVSEASGIEEEPEKSSGEEKNPERSEMSCEEQESLSSEVSADPTEASTEDSKVTEAAQEADDEEEDEWPSDFAYEMDESTWFDSCDECYLIDENKENHRPARE